MSNIDFYKNQDFIIDAFSSIFEHNPKLKQAIY